MYHMLQFGTEILFSAMQGKDVNTMTGAEKRLDWSVLEKNYPARHYPKNAMVYWQESHAEEFYYLKSGRVRIFLSSENGTEKTLTVLEHGNIFGEAAFFDGMPRVSCAKTLVDSEIIPITKENLLDCFRREPQLAMNLLTFLSQTIRMLSAQVDTMTFLQADQRLARLLLKLADANGMVQATHEDLAGLAGVSRVTVSRILGRFAEKGWILAGYGTVVIQGTGLNRFTEKNKKEGMTE